MRQRNKPWADDFLKENEHVVIPNPTSYKGKWKKLFRNNHPIYIEVGTGKGKFIVGMAKQYPNINFIGIEQSKSVIVTAAQKVIEANQPNIVLLKENAMELTDIFDSGEVANIYLNFSDPWPKNRHEKRRLTYSSFLETYRHILTADGDIIFKTDNRGLFEYSLVSFSKFGMTLEEISLDLHSLQDPTNVMTEYEEKFSAKGNPIYRCKASFKNYNS